jgi:hypothetical protein
MRNEIRFSLLAVLLVARVAVAVSFSPRVVAGDANWVLHLDMAALKASTLGQQMLANDLDARAEIQLKQAQALLGMDPREDLHAITVYGSGVDQDNAVMLIRGKFNSEKVAAAAAVMPGHELLVHGARQVHSWLEAADPSAGRMHGVLLDGSVGVISKSLANLQKALDVVDGKQASLAQGGINTANLSGDGVMLAAAGDFSGLSMGDNPMLSNVKARNFAMQLRETGGNVALRVALKQESVQDAEQSQMMLNGLMMMGMAQLQQQSPELVGLLQAITISRDADTLVANFNYPAARLAEMMKATAAADGQ